MLASESNFDPLEVLQQDLTNPDIEIQLEAVRNIPIVALAIGEENVSILLFPLINAHCFPDKNGGNVIQRDDGTLGPREEVLREIAWVMSGPMASLLGAKENLLRMLLVLLQKLCMINENIVREAAVDGVISCAKEMDSAHVVKYVFPLITLLADSME